MNCADHPEIQAAGYCRECGKPMCEACRKPANGSLYCEEHLPGAPAPAATQPVSVQPEAGSPYNAPAYKPGPAPGASPVLAFLLGFIPGVGAIYNGQYAKGLIHAIVFGLLVTIASSGVGSLEPLIGIGIAVWVFYMAFEAFHTARKRRYGQAVEEFSSLLEMNRSQSRVPAGPLILIALGTLLLLDTTDVIRLDELERYWPAGLIVFGVYLLYARLTGEGARQAKGQSGTAHSEAGQ